MPSHVRLGSTVMTDVTLVLYLTLTMMMTDQRLL